MMQGRRSVFGLGGGGGGARVRTIQIFGAEIAIDKFARRTRGKIETCVCLVVFLC